MQSENSPVVNNQKLLNKKLTAGTHVKVRLKNFLIDWYLLIVILLSWVLMTWGDETWYNPVNILNSFPVLWTEYSLLTNIWLSMQRVLGGFGIALCIALPLGVFLGMFQKAANWFEPLIESFRYMAPIAWIPLAIFWFKGGDASAIFIVAYAAFFPLIVTIISGIRNVNPSFLEVGKTLGAQYKHLIFHVYLPVTLLQTLVASRVAMATSWTVIVAAELALSTQMGNLGANGLGQLMFLLYYNNPDISLIAGAMLMVGFLALIFDVMVQLIVKLFVKWE